MMVLLLLSLGVIGAILLTPAPAYIEYRIREWKERREANLAETWRIERGRERHFARILRERYDGDQKKG